MHEKKDTFWKQFLTSTILVVVVFVGYAAVVVLLQGDAPLAIPTAFGSDPPEELLAGVLGVRVATTSPFLYRDAIPLGASDASWDAVVSWQSSQRVFEGSHSIKAQFLAGGSGVALAEMLRITTPYDGITLAVYPENLGTTTLSLILYDAHGESVGAQPLAWYHSSQTLTEGLWQEVAVPLGNLATTSVPQLIGGFAIEADGPGTVYIDSVRLATHTPPHVPWVPLPVVAPEYEDPLISLFAHAPTVSLPYELDLSLGTTTLWYTLWEGRFNSMGSYLDIAPPKEGTDGMFVFLGGRNWVNYQVSAVLDWGNSQTFGLLVRFVDDSHFATCNFSSFGASVQLSSIVNGKLHMIGETPQLPVPDIGGWKSVPVGVRVTGNWVTCLVRGEAVLSGTLPNLPSTGTVGIEVWDRSPYRMPHHLHSFSVEAVP